jgi:hypothetical protein
MLNQNLLLTGDDGYNLTKSLRFRSSASAYLNRTQSTPTTATKWTYSYWVKRGIIGGSSVQTMISGTGGGGSGIVFYNDKLWASSYTSSYQWNFLSAAVYRDTSAWYHIMVAYDSTQATDTNRVKIYVNGVQLTAFTTDVGATTYPSLNSVGFVGGVSGSVRIGLRDDGFYYFDGYLAEMYFVDGQQLTPSSFGETSTTTGVWIPKKYTGTYGTNGFYLPFTDTTSTSTLGTDFSGNSNTWTVNNISLTSGSTYDSMTDVPTLTSATVANYAVMNPLTTGSFTTLSAANLNTLGNTSSNNGNSRSTFAMLTGKWYIEVTLTANSLSVYPQLGIVTTADGNRPNNGSPQAGYSSGLLNPTQSVIYMADGTKQINNSASSYGSSFTNGDVIGIAIDSDNGAIYFSKNGTFQNSGVPTSGSSKTGAALTWTGGTVEHFFSIADYNGTATAANFGQQPFAYTPPTGFVALNTFNLPTPTIGATASSQANKYFDATTYTGNGSALTVTNSGAMQPDLLWTKARSSGAFHYLQDSVRGVNKALFSNSTDSEFTITTTTTTLNSNGFSFNGSESGLNANTSTYVGWQWRASNATAVTNTQGSITSTVSANTTAGFSIVTWTGNGASSATIGHGLGVAPSMIIVKNRSATWGWFVYNKFLTNPNTGRLQLNLTNGEIAGGTPGPWNNTAPTSTVFSLGDSSFPEVNGSGNLIVAYCFAPIAGYSAFGSYVGNGVADGPFIYTGFRPRYFILKNITNAQSWSVQDTSRSPYNVASAVLLPNSSSAELTGTDFVDILSNGFKIRHSSSGNNNNSGDTYIYMAFAESPFKYANAR